MTTTCQTKTQINLNHLTKFTDFTKSTLAHVTSTEIKLVLKSADFKTVSELLMSMYTTETKLVFKTLKLNQPGYIPHEYSNAILPLVEIFTQIQLKS